MARRRRQQSRDRRSLAGPLNGQAAVTGASPFSDPNFRPIDQNDFVQKMVQTPDGPRLYVAFHDHNGKIVQTSALQLNVERQKNVGIFLDGDVRVDRSALQQVLQIQKADTKRDIERKNRLRGAIGGIIETEMRDAPIAERVKFTEGLLNRIAWGTADKDLVKKIERDLHSGYWQKRAKHGNQIEINMRALDVALMGTHLMGPASGNAQGKVGFGDGYPTGEGVDGNHKIEKHGIEDIQLNMARRGKRLPIARLENQDGVYRLARIEPPALTVASLTSTSDSPATDRREPDPRRLANDGPSLRTLSLIEMFATPPTKTSAWGGEPKAGPPVSSPNSVEPDSTLGRVVGFAAPSLPDRPIPKGLSDFAASAKPALRAEDQPKPKAAQDLAPT